MSGPDIGSTFLLAAKYQWDFGPLPTIIFTISDDVILSINHDL